MMIPRRVAKAGKKLPMDESHAPVPVDFTGGATDILPLCDWEGCWIFHRSLDLPDTYREESYKERRVRP